jgi:hypothetical protein
MRRNKGNVMKSSLVIALSIFAATAALAPAEAKTMPSATATFSGDSVAVGVVFTWGNGVLTFRGKRYPFKVDGLSAVGLGMNSINGTGEIYHLTNVADFAGTYGTAGAGSTISKGQRGRAILENDKGVVIEFRAKEIGAEVSLAAGGVVIRLTPPN